ncbi:SLC13 family permease [Desulfogranum japonicum]|uniref:SLC13 family permease n=1 Tax=Desulfogranum japonicum TaxID=231447 RepID=UPI000408E09D|nr:SLC13 family permease [Desulfogranum japonicum]
MSLEILLVLIILMIVIIVLITEVMPLEVLALLVLGTLAITGLVNPTEALAGFSNPAVVTIWAVFILSGGLTRTGIANILGRNLLKVVGTGISRLIISIMLLSGILSAFMNNVAVAALMLPVVMDISRKTGKSPSILLMPLAYGSLLGGVTTMIGTPPNILVSEALRANGLVPFGLFDFTPVGILVMIFGMLFVTFIGRHFLPQQTLLDSDKNEENLIIQQYRIQERLFKIYIPKKSALVGHTLASSHLGSGFGLNVIGISRDRQTFLAPDPFEKIKGNDELIVEGRLDRIQEMNNWGQLLSEDISLQTNMLQCFDMQVAEVQITENNPWVGKTISTLNFRNRYGVNVLEILRFDRKVNIRIKAEEIVAGDILVLHGPIDNINKLHNREGVASPVILEKDIVEQKYEHDNNIRLFSVPDTSRLLGMTISDSCLGDALDIQILAIVREDNSAVIPASDVMFEPGDRLLVSGMCDLVGAVLLQGLEAVFEHNQSTIDDFSLLQSDKVGFVEVILSPHSTLAGQSLQQISFREKFGLTVLAVLRKGKITRSGLRDFQLQLGDAMLVFGEWKKLHALSQNPDFVILTEKMQEIAREEKASTALAIMTFVLLPVIFGWVPIYIAVVVGAAFMVLTKCLTMEEAYRYIEWKAVFLIAGMLPLGTALDKSGAAALAAEKVITVFGSFGPYGVLLGILSITFLATSIIPTAALVVLMVPIALKISVSLGMSPYPFMMGIAMAASSSFTSPISHPANVLVMGPGGYKFMDYVKIGVPLTLGILVLLMAIIPFYWPFTGEISS